MKLSHLLIFLPALAGLSMTACNRESSKPPVVQDVPVFTRPFDDGYAAGFAAGKLDAKPKGRLPKEEVAETKAADAAASDPACNEKWRRGWAEGYMDAFREVTQNRR